MSKSFRSFDEFKTELLENHELQEEFRKDPEAAAEKYSGRNPLDSDKWIYRIIVIALGATVLFIILGVIVLMILDKIGANKEVPTILTAIGSAAIGAMAGLLAPAPKR